MIDEKAFQAAIPVGSNIANEYLVRAIIEAYEAAKPAAEAVAWREQDVGWCYYDRDNQPDLVEHIEKHQKDRHGISIFPLYATPAPAPPSDAVVEACAKHLDDMATALWERCETKRADPPCDDEKADASQAFALEKAAASIRALIATDAKDGKD